MFWGEARTMGLQIGEESLVKTVLRPRNEGEALKRAEVLLRSRNKDRALTTLRAEKLKEYADKLKHKAKASRDLGYETPEKLIKKNRASKVYERRMRYIGRPGAPVRKARHITRSKVLFVIRNGRRNAPRSVSGVLTSLNLPKKYTASFVRNDEATLHTLKLVEPFVFYGILPDDLARHLFERKLRFVGSIEGAADESSSAAASPVLDNMQVEERLGHLGLLCIDDVRAEVLSCGTHFDVVSKHIAPFPLTDIMKADR